MRRTFRMRRNKQLDEHEDAFCRSYARNLLAIARYQRRNGGETSVFCQVLEDAGKYIRRACHLTMQRTLG